MTDEITAEDLATYEGELSKVKVLLMNEPDSTFITSIFFALMHKFSDEITTAYTDGKEIVHGIELWKKSTTGQRMFVQLHETWHVAFGHCLKDGREDKALYPDRQKVNDAMDHVINLMLKECTNSKMQVYDWVLADPQYAGMSWEKVYNLLPDDRPDNPMGGDVGEGVPESGDPGKDKIAYQKAKEDLDNILIQAAIASQAAGDTPGSIPGNILAKIEALTKPKLPWDQILSRYLTSMAKTDYTFRKPNRRFMPDYFVPTAYSEAVGRIGMAFDMSCSVSDKEITQYISDVYHVLKKIRPEEINLVQFDTEVFSVDTIKTEQELMKLVFKGRGGTSIHPVMDWAASNKKETPDVLVVFSDGHFCDARVKPKVPVIWVIHNNPHFTAPFGKVIHYDI